MNRFIETLIGHELVPLAEKWHVQGWPARIQEGGRVLDRIGISPIVVRLAAIGTVAGAR